MMSGSRFQCSKAEHFAGAPEAGLHFVADEQRAVLAAKLLRAVKEIVSRKLHALALHRLDDERGDIALRSSRSKRVEVIERRYAHRIPA